MPPLQSAHHLEKKRTRAAMLTQRPGLLVKNGKLLLAKNEPQPKPSVMKYSLEAEKRLSGMMLQ
jgi:hypothetical protein